MSAVPTRSPIEAKSCKSAWARRTIGFAARKRGASDFAHPTAEVPSPPRQRMAGHQVVGMLPARQRLDALEPGGDILVLGGDVEAELIGRVVEIGDERKVGDGRAVADKVGASREPLVENAKRVVDAPLEKGEHGGIARRPGES